MLFQIRVSRDGEEIYATDVADREAARRTAEYLSVKYDDRADRIEVFGKDGLEFRLVFDREAEDWVERFGDETSP